MSSARFVRSVVTLALLTVGSMPATAQGIGSLRKKAEEAKKKAEAALDKAKSDTSKATTPAAAGAASAPGTPSPGSASAADAAAKPSAKVWENYDFVPGERILRASGRQLAGL